MKDQFLKLVQIPELFRFEFIYNISIWQREIKLQGHKDSGGEEKILSLGFKSSLHDNEMYYSKNYPGIVIILC